MRFDDPAWKWFGDEHPQDSPETSGLAVSELLQSATVHILDRLHYLPDVAVVTCKATPGNKAMPDPASLPPRPLDAPRYGS